MFSDKARESEIDFLKELLEKERSERQRLQELILVRFGLIIPSARSNGPTTQRAVSRDPMPFRDAARVSELNAQAKAHSAKLEEVWAKKAEEASKELAAEGKEKLNG